MFAKLLLMGFNYEFIETFCFPDDKAKEFYETYKLELIFPYHVLTDTNSTCLFFIFVCKPECNAPDEKFRNLLFTVIVNNRILEKIDTFHWVLGTVWRKIQNVE